MSQASTPWQPLTLFKSFFYKHGNSGQSILADIIFETKCLVEFDPDILSRIESDRDRLAREKKLSRLQDAASHSGTPLPLSGASKSPECSSDNLILLTGRTRMPAYLVLVFTMIRAWLGGSKESIMRTMIEESVTISDLLAHYGLKLPGGSTITDNCNMVSLDTLEYIHQVGLRMARKEGLDDFKKVAFDSTAVESQSSFPTDSDIIRKLLFRARRSFELLSKFDLKVQFAQNIELKIEDVAKLATEIALVGRGKKAKKKRHKAYMALYKKAMASRTHLKNGLGRLAEQRSSLKFKASQLKRIDIIKASISDDLRDLKKAINSSKSRIKDSKKVPSTDKILSVSDPSAAMIIKGGRDTIFGYRPQIGRSTNGLITAFSLEEGNTADSTQLLPIVKKHIANTKVTPVSVSVDDGYASKEGLSGCLGISGITRVSMSGAKGKKIIPEKDYESEEYRELRCFRSTAESTIGHLKQCYGFGLCTRSGISAVRCELMEKVLCFNLRKTVALRFRAAA